VAVAAWFSAGVLLGAVVGVLAGTVFGRHDDRSLLHWWVVVSA
jgi:hypothetical protein